MFFFKVDLYKFPPNISSLPATFNLSDYPILDKDRLISYLDIPFNSINERLPYPEGVSQAESILGSENYASIYLASYNIVSSNEYNTANWNFNIDEVPSISAMYPNYISLVKDYLYSIPPYGYNEMSYRIGFHFKSLSIFLSPVPSGENNSGVFSVNNGVCSAISDYKPAIPNIAGSSNKHIIMLGYENYKEGDDLTDKSKWYIVDYSGRQVLDKLVYITQRRLSDDEYRSLLTLFNSDTVADKEFHPTNPYEPAEPSGPGILPPGTFDDDSDPIPDSTLPSISAANTGFTRIYNPTLSQVQQLARYLWTDESIITTIWNHIKQYFEDPMQAIIGFNLVPCAVPDGGAEEFAIMYIGTGVQMTVAANQFVDVDCGTYTLERYYGSALDQSPYTKVSCFLPYIGTVQLNTDEVMGTELQVKYRIDIVTGSCVAKIFIDGSCLYQYSGHCAINIPISSADFSSYVSAAISIAKLAATAGIAALAGGGDGSAATDALQQTGRTVTTQIDTVNTVRNPTTGRQVTSSATHQTVTANYSPPPSQATQASFGGLSPSNVSNTVGQIMSSKPVINHSGSFSGNSGYLGVRRPFLIIERPNMCLPENYQTLNGYPAMITMLLGECQGYTRVQQVQLTGMWATNPEQAEIQELLKGGVIF